LCAPERCAAGYIDVHLPAELAQGFQLAVVDQGKALKRERCSRPRPVELGDVHAEPQFAHGNRLFFHATV
jgi:hypothetical protein